jgi:branched-subunit amino acid transport protein
VELCSPAQDRKRRRPLFDLLAVVLAGLGTYVERVIFLVTKKVRPPARSLRYLPLVGPAVLGAIAVPGIFAPSGEVSFAQTVPALVAAVVAWLLWRWTKQLVIGLVGGLAIWWGLIFVFVQLGWR